MDLRSFAFGAVIASLVVVVVVVVVVTCMEVFVVPWEFVNKHCVFGPDGTLLPKVCLAHSCAGDIAVTNSFSFVGMCAYSVEQNSLDRTLGVRHSSQCMQSFTLCVWMS
eukprot:5498633-Amphidinium_carterae.1